MTPDERAAALRAQLAPLEKIAHDPANDRPARVQAFKDIDTISQAARSSYADRTSIKDNLDNLHAAGFTFHRSGRWGYMVKGAERWILHTELEYRYAALISRQ